MPVGLLHDIHVLSSASENVKEGTAPWKLTVHFAAATSDTDSDAKTAALNQVPVTPAIVNDAFINSVKEADFLRSGTAKPIMSLSKAESKALWSSTQDHDLATFNKVYNSLLPNTREWRSIPLRIFIPSSTARSFHDGVDNETKASVRVVQGQVAPYLATTSAGPSTRTGFGGIPQTLGTALHALLPSLFPSRRTAMLARPLLHGVKVPMAAGLEDLARFCSYADGWICIVVQFLDLEQQKDEGE